MPPRRARRRAADSDSDFDPEASSSESDEVIGLEDLGEPRPARKRKVRIDVSDEDEPERPRRDPSAPSGSTPSSRPVRATRARVGKPKPLELRRGIRDRSPSSSSDDVDGDPVRVTRTAGRRKQLTTRERRRTRKTRKSSGTPGSGERPKWVGRVRAPRDENPWEWGTMRSRPDFYDRRAKHGIVNMEKVSDDSSPPGSSSDDFIDDGDASDAPASVEAFDLEEAERAARAKRSTRTRAETRSRRASSASESPSDERTTRRSARRRGGASAATSARKKPLRRKLVVAESSPSPSPPGSEDDVPSRGRRATRSDREIVTLEDDAPAPTPAPAPAPGESPAKRSERVQSRRERAAEAWRVNRERMARGMRREEAELEYRDIEDIEREEMDAEMRFDRLGGDDDDLEGFVVAEPEPANPRIDERLRRRRRGDPGGVGTRRRRSRAVLESDSSAPSESESPTYPESEASESESVGWVNCECGACEDDGAMMAQCDNPRCGMWQHAACVDASDVRAFFCRRCASAGGKRAPAPPDKPGVSSALGGVVDEDDEYRAGPHGRLKCAFQGDDEETMLDAMECLLESVPSRRALLNRACAARAWTCLRALLGGPWPREARDTRGGAPDPSRPGERAADAARASRDRRAEPPVSAARLPRASTESIGHALHVSLARGDARAVETIRSVMGEAFARPPPFSSTRRWPLSPLGDGGTLVHSAAENDAANARCVWLALEAEGEGPPGGFEHTAEPGTAARAAAIAREPRSVGTVPPLGGTETRPHRDSKPRHVALGDCPAAGVGDTSGLTPLMRAAGRGDGWEGCVAALLRSAAVFVNDSPFLGRGVVGGVGARLFAPGAEGEAAKARVANATPATRAFAGAAAAAAMRDAGGRASAAHFAAGAGAVASLRLLAWAYPGCARATDATGATPLHHAAACGDAACVRALADELGASRVAKDNKAWIPLLYADFADELGCGSDSRSAATALMARDLEAQLVALGEAAEDPIGKPRAVRCVRSLAENPACYEALNAFLRDRPELLDRGAPLEFLLRLETARGGARDGDSNDETETPRVSVLDFPTRRAWLRRALRDAPLGCRDDSFRVDRFDDDADSIGGEALDAREPWNDLVRWALRRGAAAFRAPLHLSARLAANASGPGAERDFMERVARDLIGGGVEDERARATSLPLLTRATDADAAYRPPHLADPLPKRLEAAYFVLGQLLGYAVARGSPLPLDLASAFLRGALGRGAPARDPLEELEQMDAGEARSLRAVATMPAEAVADLRLTFAVDETATRVGDGDGASGASETVSREVPLTGRSTDQTPTTSVTAANRDAYVRLRAAHQVARVTSSAAARAARAGFAELVPLEALSRAFSVAEVALLVGGAAAVDVDDMRKHARYGGGYEAGSDARLPSADVRGDETRTTTTSRTFPQPEWLWRFLRRASEHERAMFLKFVTGSSRLPPGGFAALSYPLTVNRAPLDARSYAGDADAEADVVSGPDAERDAAGDASAARRAARRRGGPLPSAKTKKKTSADPKRFPLPTAATCFNVLRLPEYPSEAILQHRVATALRHGVEGFGFA